MNTMRWFAAAMAAWAAVGNAWLAQAEQPPLKVHMISGSDEYKSESSLTGLKTYLEKHYHVVCTLSLGKDKGNDLPGLEALEEADVMLVFCRRVRPSKGQLGRIMKWCEAGKPVVGIRTASHAFQEWPEFDKTVLGGDYQGHSGQEEIRVTIEDEARDHPILAGVTEWTGIGKFYRNPHLAQDVTLLLMGTSKNEKQPLAWARTYNREKGGRSFYTSMGLPEDFENENFKRMLAGAIFWTAHLTVWRNRP